MIALAELAGWLYVYCTDFCIHLANLTGTSYYEVNFFFFCVVYPVLAVVLPVGYLVQRWRLRRLRGSERSALTA